MYRGCSGIEVMGMKKLFTAVKTALLNGESVVLCTVIASHGSTPRGAGAKMAVFPDGKIAGTIGGGAVEFQCIRQALTLHESRGTALRGFTLRENDVADIGMVCGGDVTVHFLFLDALVTEHLTLVSSILDSLNRRENSWLVTEIKIDAPVSMGVFDKVRGLTHKSALTTEEILPHCQRRAVYHDTAPQFYVEPLGVAERVFLFGGGHISQALVPLLSTVDFNVIVCENRAEFAEKSLFPNASDIVLGAFSEVFQRNLITSEDYIVIMTRGHADDYEILKYAMQTPATYLGVIGSKRKTAISFQRLREDGFGEIDISRVHAPIGLPIGAQSPAEIAISVTAELIKHRAER